MRTLMTLLCAVTLAVGATDSCFGAIIDFTGGTAYLSPSGTAIPNNDLTYHNVDYYEENGFKLDFIGGDGIIGMYYAGALGDVIHAHWATGIVGTVTEVRVTKLDGAAFDMNYFVLTSNTDTGGNPASGNELAYVNASVDGTTISYSQLLPPEDWGVNGVNPAILLGPQFDNVKMVSFTAASPVDCFGMDSFYINEPAPIIPEPATLALLALGGVGLWRRRRRTA